MPLYFLRYFLAVTGKAIALFSPAWLPDWLKFVTMDKFLFIAVGLGAWLFCVFMFSGVRSETTIDAIGMGCALPMLEDGLSGYLLLAGLLVAFVGFNFFR